MTHQSLGMRNPTPQRPAMQDPTQSHGRHSGKENEREKARCGMSGGTEEQGQLTDDKRVMGSHPQPAICVKVMS